MIFRGYFPWDSRFAREEWAARRFINDANADRVRRLISVADELCISRAQLALAWTLRLPWISSAIIGATRPSQVIDNAAAAEIRLTSEITDRIEQILAG